MSALPTPEAPYPFSDRNNNVAQRIQLSRRKGWRKPEDAIIVARPSRWGGPFKIEDKTVLVGGIAWWGESASREDAVRLAVSAFRWQLLNHPNVIGFTVREVQESLAGHDLACWCPLDQPCRADVLLRIANEPARDKERM